MLTLQMSKYEEQIQDMRNEISQLKKQNNDDNVIEMECMMENKHTSVKRPITSLHPITPSALTTEQRFSEKEGSG